MNSFFSIDELTALGLKSFGQNVLISRFARIYSPEKMTIGDNVRIDDFCILSGEIILGSFIHISAYCALYGKFGIEMEDNTGLSPRCTVFSATDDFTGDYLIGPMVNADTTNVQGGKVRFRKFSQIGAGCVVMPGITVGEGATVGAMSFVNKSIDPWQVHAGVPAKFIKNRKRIF